jgi:release factor glutamine methyltransferase
MTAVVARLRAAGSVYAEDEARLLAAEARTPAELAALVDRRVAGEPLEYILGWAAFCGLRISVEPGVFIPRRRTEFLVREAVPLTGPGNIVVDLCCGSGAVAAALAAVVERIDVHAVDVDAVAVRCARANLAAAGGRVYEGDLYGPLPAALRGRVDVLVANVPYVPSGDIRLLPREARLHEPRATYDGGVDGLDIARRVAAAAPQWLAAGGHLLVETSADQAAPMAECFARHGLAARVSSSDDLDATVVIGVRASG